MFPLYNRRCVPSTLRGTNVLVVAACAHIEHKQANCSDRKTAVTSPLREGWEESVSKPQRFSTFESSGALSSSLLSTFPPSSQFVPYPIQHLPASAAISDIISLDRNAASRTNRIQTIVQQDTLSNPFRYTIRQFLIRVQQAIDPPTYAQSEHKLFLSFLGSAHFAHKQHPTKK